jgi:hypothetical protein
MDVDIKSISKRMNKDVKELQKAGFDVWGETPPTYDVDGEIDLGNDMTVTVTLDGKYYTTTRKGHKIVFSDDYSNIKDVIKQLKKEKK